MIASSRARRATPDETWAGLTAPVVRLRDDGTAESYTIPVEVWIVDGPDALAQQRRAALAAAEAAKPRPVLREWVPSSFDADGTPVFGLT